MSSISQEQPPFEIDEDLREYLIRFRTDVDSALKAASKFPERKQMPYKPQIGDQHYFGNPATHNYDAVITDEGMWAYTVTGWRRLDLAGGGGGGGLACPGYLPFFNRNTTQDNIDLVGGTEVPFFNRDTTQDNIDVTCSP